MSPQNIPVNPVTAPDWLADIRAWVLDVDGCLVNTAQAGGVGGTAFPEAAEFIAAAKAAGDTVVVCTNASQKPPAAYAAHLRDMGLDIEDDEFVSAGAAAAEYIAQFYPDARVLVLGDVGITEPAKNLQVNMIDPADTNLADVVVVGAMDGIGRAELNAGALAVDAGAPLYSTVVSPWFHGGQGKALTISATLAAAVGWPSNTTPEVVGKPSKALADTLRLRLGIPTHQIAVVGDAPAEIGLARRMGARAVTVLSGALTTDDLGSDSNSPDLAVNDIAALHQVRQSITVSS